MKREDAHINALLRKCFNNNPPVFPRIAVVLAEDLGNIKGLPRLPDDYRLEDMMLFVRK